MALAQPPPMHDRKRVKVYELKNNDWYDRGTGFCTGTVVQPPPPPPDDLDARIIVVSEDDPNRTLLETRIARDDGYQKQQDTLIVWTEQNGIDMALSFQEAEGCANIWDFVSEVQQKLAQFAPDDGLSDDLLDPLHPFVLPPPELGRLDDIDDSIRAAAQSPTARDALAKFVMSPDQMYILKLAPLVTQAEEQQSLPDLHKLCSIMKNLILLNDTQIIEFAVTDQAIMGVVGALEYDPDFPSHRANHRQYLSDSSKFKEVVPIKEPNIRKKIHATYRLLYLKDVVLARILDDPTFSVLNSLIFFQQVDILNYIQTSQDFLKELFGIFDESANETDRRKKEAVLFIQNCCAASKNTNAQSRAQLYQNFIIHGLFTIIAFALRHHEASVRVAGTDILVALIDHDPHMVRSYIFQAIKEKAVPLTDTLIELLLVEVDLGVKSQMADAIKILLDPGTMNGMDMMARQANGEIMAKRGNGPGASLNAQNQVSPQTEQFIHSFYDDSAKRLFQPLKDLEHRPSMLNLTAAEASLYTHLVEVLCFFVRHHAYRSKLFILSENLHARVAQLLRCPQKYIKLTALKWFRTCVGLQDEFHNRQMIQNRLFEPILDIVYETMPRDSLLNSACLELFEFIRHEGLKQLLVHLVEQYRDRLVGITYVNTFHGLVRRYEQIQAGYSQAGPEDSSFTTQEGTPHRMVNGRQTFAGLKEMDSDEEAYFSTDDDDAEDEEGGLPTSAKMSGMPNGASPVRPLVNYPDDDEEPFDMLASSPDRHVQQQQLMLAHEQQKSSSPCHPASTAADVEAGEAEPSTADTSPEAHERGRSRVARAPIEESQSPPEPIAMKRRRDDEDDELGKMMGGIKRRNSSTSVSSQAGRLQLDGSGSPTSSNYRGGSLQQQQQQPQPQPHQQQSQHRQHRQQHPTHDHQATGHGHAPTLRRKGSLKTKNETQGTADKFAIKPVHLRSVRRPMDAENGNGDGVDGGGGDDDGGGKG